MAKRPAEHPDSVDAIALIRVVLDALERPALLVQDPDTIVVVNAAWQGLFTEFTHPHEPPPLLQWLDTLEGGESIATALTASARVATPHKARVKHCSGGTTLQFDVCVLPASVSESGRTIRLLTLSEISVPVMSGGGPASSDYMHRLLLRQTLIEERERRRLGQALHDQVSQLLVRLRRQLAEVRDGRDSLQCVAMIDQVDHVIDVLRELTFAFSPPVLEDLGLLPAIRWLAEHLRESYGATVLCTDDDIEPRLSSDVRTIAFRAVRELSNNAVKHAPGSSISLKSRVKGECWRLEVADDGPGFREGGAPGVPQPLPGYGLLSIEQQIRSVGGTFVIHSSPDSGTRAMITLRTASGHETTEAENA